MSGHPSGTPEHVAAVIHDYERQAARSADKSLTWPQMQHLAAAYAARHNDTTRVCAIRRSTLRRNP